MVCIDMNIVQRTNKVISFAVQAHGDQKYGEHEYIVHLAQVFEVLLSFGFRDIKWVEAAYLHDVVEDTEVTVAELIKEFGVEVAELVASVSGFGANRKEKQANILNKLYFHPEACILKIADRIANIEAGVREGNEDKLKMYRAEQNAFAAVVKKNVPDAMWIRLEQALNGNQR